MNLSIVIPAHNEESNLKKIAELLLKNFDEILTEIIIVNDCSTDSTKIILNKLSKKNLKIVPIHRGENKGVGNAIRDGLKKLSSKSDYVLLLDCDFTRNIDNIKEMIESSTEADGILGSRYIRKNSLSNYPLVKKIANRLFHVLIRFLLSVHHRDISNNFKLYKAELIKKIIPLLKSSGFSINAETGIYPILLGYNLKEIPVVWIGRTNDMGKSSFNVFKAGPGYIKVLIDVLKFKYFSKKNTHKHSPVSERHHFDALVKKTGETYYGNLRPIASVRFKRKAQLILQQLEKIHKPKVLDLGCGTGILSRYILQQRPILSIEGIDVSLNAIKIAQKTLRHYPNARFQTGNALNLPFKENSFDMVMGNSILHHISLEESLAEIKRVLKPKGKIWFCEPNMLNPQIAVEKNIPFLKPLFQDSEDERAFSRWGIKRDLQSQGFRDVKATPYEFLHPLIPKFAIKYLVPLLILFEKIPVINEFSGTMQIIGINGKR